MNISFLLCVSLRITSNLELNKNVMVLLSLESECNPGLDDALELCIGMECLSIIDI